MCSGWGRELLDKEILKTVSHWLKNKEIISKLAGIVADDRDYFWVGLQEGHFSYNDIELVLSHRAVSKFHKNLLRQWLKLGPPALEVIPKKEARTGSIYLARSLHDFTKICFSSSASKREIQLKRMDSGVEIFYVSAPIFTTQHERKLHLKFKDYKEKGEWFDLSHKQIEKIKSFLDRKGMVI